MIVHVKTCIIEAKVYVAIVIESRSIGTMMLLGGHDHEIMR